MSDATRPTIPADGLILGYGPMLPLVAAGCGTWLLPHPWPALAIRLALIWGALILAFIGGVRRGFGFARDSASKPREIAAAVVYVAVAGVSLAIPRADVALPTLAAGYALAALADRRAAIRGDAPLYFARLRVPQLLIGCAGLLACWAGLVA
jgi:hypothetical protein